jgi:hypothetical protein
MQYPTTWWESTGKHTPFDKHGIAHVIYRNLKTGELTSTLPIGALYASDGGPKGPDGLSIVCVVPFAKEGYSNKTTEWHIDGRANNCDMPGDKEHRCWCRHGTVGEEIHVDKIGKTCGAGAGSIGVPGFHGFLHHGVLRKA